MNRPLLKNHVWYRGYLIPETQKKELENMIGKDRKTKFGELNEGDKFKYNTFLFKKGGEDAGDPVKKFIVDKANIPLVNATCLSEDGWSAHFVDDVWVHPVENSDENGT